MQREKSLSEDVDSASEVFEAYEDPALPKLRWREVRLLGKGTFSRVVLARLIASPDNEIRYGESKELVAVKIVEITSAGGASRERIESGLKREVDILKNLNHACLIHLIAFNLEPTRALIVLPYCHGGDLFDLATSTSRLDLLQPHVVRRLFAEVVSAVGYLHRNNIVHRDIKLENVLLVVDQSAVESAVHESRPLTCLTDFGLSRQIDPSNPLLTTRCGSEDYAPPELIMGQSYDGRQTDAWALGVLLYALMEGRFPFDSPPPLPGSASRKSGSARNRVKHRIARIEWCWVRFRRRTENEDDVYSYDHDLDSSDEDETIADINLWTGAQQIVERCLRRKDSRISVNQIAESPWLKGAVDILGIKQ
ncbi:kinase-like domain-containing protein [Lipomyces arxii]|uniref:kinase-like domain-containing protein n=1 Tax=Lipomyces arxii TaxID=56418 RepID=UPI0034CD6370